MTKAGGEDEPKDELRDLLDSTMSAFVITKRRYLLVAATVAELERIERHMSGLDSEAKRHPGNDAVFQMLRDSFDMLVIDLASIREGITAKSGLLGRLKNDFISRLRRWAPEDIEPQKGVVYGGDPATHEEFLAQHDALIRRQIADNANGVLERLIPGEYPVTQTGIGTLIDRFRRDTEAIDRDRNHVRAHRYEHRQGDRNRYFCSPDAVGEHLKVMESYLVDLYLVLTLGDYHATLDFNSSAKHVAKDLADLIVHGSINRAANVYGMSERTETNPVPWYRAYRKKFFGESF